MNFVSTRNKNYKVSFEKAVMTGLSEDGGLFVPENVPVFEKKFFENLKNYSFQEIGNEIAKKYIGNEIPEKILRDLIFDAINFPAPIKELNNKYFVLELFHGPTLAFKDFGARFMSRIMGHFNRNENKELNILVATSGDTGSAVANGFYNVDGINVYILYPKNKVSEIQEKQLTTLGRNITALEVEGTFDDCQKMVKDAFLDSDLTSKMRLTSANSINIARLLPQTFYYFEAIKQVSVHDKNIVVSVPSGNLGNLTAGLLAKKMGLNINKFVSATNLNSVFTEYLQSGVFKPRQSVKTFSNAMDVGNPSNLERVNSLYDFLLSQIREDIFSLSFDDNDTIKEIQNIFQKYNYVIDPHGAVGFLALKQYLMTQENSIGIVFETAHPAKFRNVVENSIGSNIEIPERLSKCIAKEKNAVQIKSDLKSLKAILLENGF